MYVRETVRLASKPVSKMCCTGILTPVNRRRRPINIGGADGIYFMHVHVAQRCTCILRGGKGIRVHVKHNIYGGSGGMLPQGN